MDERFVNRLGSPNHPPVQTFGSRCPHRRLVSPNLARAGRFGVKSRLSMPDRRPGGRVRFAPHPNCHPRHLRTLSQPAVAGPIVSRRADAPPAPSAQGPRARPRPGGDTSSWTHRARPSRARTVVVPAREPKSLRARERWAKQPPMGASEPSASAAGELWVREPVVTRLCASVDAGPGAGGGSSGPRAPGAGLEWPPGPGSSGLTRSHAHAPRPAHGYPRQSDRGPHRAALRRTARLQPPGPARATVAHEDRAPRRPRRPAGNDSGGPAAGGVAAGTKEGRWRRPMRRAALCRSTS